MASIHQKLDRVRKPRVHITYDVETEGATVVKELPFVVGVLGDFSGDPTEPQKPLSLTAGRRLQLAAEAGRTTGLLLIRQEAGSNATETRWSCEPRAGAAADSTLHRWSLNKNKTGTSGSWVVNWNGASAAVDMVPKARQRHEPEDTAR